MHEDLLKLWRGRSSTSTDAPPCIRVTGMPLPLFPGAYRETTRHQRGSSSVSSVPLYIGLPLDRDFYSRTKIKFERGISHKGLEYWGVSAARTHSFFQLS